jgi:hypothetical protein
MFGSPLKLLATLGAAGLALGTAQAGSLCCAGCGEPCVAHLVEEVVVPVAPFYLVDQGPVFYGPAITRGPSYFEEITSSHHFPYIGNAYYLPMTATRMLTRCATMCYTGRGKGRGCPQWSTGGRRIRAC